jgi:hypothetical protein
MIRQEEIQDQASVAKLHIPMKYLLLLVLVLAVIAFLVLLWNFYWRASSQIDRILGGFDLGRLPESAENLIIEKEKRGLFSTHITFIGFTASETDIFSFLNTSLDDPRDEPVALASFHLGPKLSSWMKWDSASDGRVYHFDRYNTSIWLAVDDGSDGIYIYMFRHSPNWLYKFRTYIPFMK